MWITRQKAERIVQKCIIIILAGYKSNLPFNTGKQRAYVAVAHSMLIATYHILKDGVVFKDLGADYYNQFNKERKINAYLKKLKSLGWESPVVAT